MKRSTKATLLTIGMILLFIAILVVGALFLPSCVSDQQKQESQYIDDRFFTVAGYDIGGSIVVDRETGVCYLRELRDTSYGSYGYMTVLLHADGTPILYIDGEMK